MVIPEWLVKLEVKLEPIPEVELETVELAREELKDIYEMIGIVWI